mgnify:CR=1 FL=1
MLRKVIGLLLLLALGAQLYQLVQGLRLPEVALADTLALITLILLGGLSAFYLLSRRRWKYRYLLPLMLLFVINTTVAGVILASVYVDQQLAQRSYAGIYNDCHKIWGARGLVQEGPNITPDGSQNSVASISLALSRGAKGNEVDVFFDRDWGEFIVSHDYPYNLKQGSILTLENLFRVTGKQGYVWLDFKKLRHLNSAELAQSVAELARIAASTDLKQRIYVEGEAPFSLAAYRDAGFNTIFDTHPLPESMPLASAIIAVYKLVYYFGDYSVMAMNYGEIDDPIYGPTTRRQLGSIPVFIYHVDDHAETLQALSNMPTVRVILVENHSLDRYSVNACAANN